MMTAGLVDSLDTPGVEHFTGIGPVEPSPVLPHSSVPPVPVHVVVPGSDPPVPELRLLLELPDLSSDSASAAEDFFPEPGSLSAWPGFVKTFWPKLGGSPPSELRPKRFDEARPCRERSGLRGGGGGSERAPPEPGGFM